MMDEPIRVFYDNAWYETVEVRDHADGTSTVVLRPIGGYPIRQIITKHQWLKARRNISHRPPRKGS